MEQSPRVRCANCNCKSGACWHFNSGLAYHSLICSLSCCKMPVRMIKSNLYSVHSYSAVSLMVAFEQTTYWNHYPLDRHSPGLQGNTSRGVQYPKKTEGKQVFASKKTKVMRMILILSSFYMHKVTKKCESRVWLVCGQAEHLEIKVFESQWEVGSFEAFLKGGEIVWASNKHWLLIPFVGAATWNVCELKTVLDRESAKTHI